jgi:hypothetical protein
MKRTVLIFGLISGLVSSAMMFLTLPLLNNGVIDFSNGAVIGYTAIFLSFVLVFFGIRSYRESHGGTITFGRAFSVGILITLISSAFYVASWEVIYYNFMPDFAEKCEQAELAKLQKKGASDAAILEKKKELDQLMKLYDNPVTNAAVTFIEPFPVGLIVTLVSAGILRKRRAAGLHPENAVTA